WRNVNAWLDCLRHPPMTRCREERAENRRYRINGRTIMIKPMTAIAAFALAGAAFIAPALAQDVKLPPTMTMTAYDTGTAGFNITVAIGKMMKDKYGSDVRVLPAGNDVARLAPLRAGRAIASGMGSGVYFAQEGVFE